MQRILSTCVAIVLSVGPLPAVYGVAGHCVMPKRTRSALDEFTLLPDGKYWCEWCAKGFSYGHCSEHLKLGKHVTARIRGTRHPPPVFQEVVTHAAAVSGPECTPTLAQSGGGDDSVQSGCSGGVVPTSPLSPQPVDVPQLKEQQPPPPLLKHKLALLTRVSTELADEAHPDETDPVPVQRDTDCLFGSLLTMVDDAAYDPDVALSTQRYCEV